MKVAELLRSPPLFTSGRFAWLKRRICFALSDCHPLHDLPCLFVVPREHPHTRFVRRDQGVSSRKQQYYGGSAAQSTLFPALDAALEVSHSAHSSNAFLLEMRNYMPPGSCRVRVWPIIFCEVARGFSLKRHAACALSAVPLCRVCFRRSALLSLWRTDCFRGLLAEASTLRGIRVELSCCYIATDSN